MIEWKTAEAAKWTYCEFELSGTLDPATLGAIALPEALSRKTDRGLILSGKGPVWLYAYLVHLAHPFAWIACYEPRSLAGVVVQSHQIGGPKVGDFVAVPPDIELAPAPVTAIAAHSQQQETVEVAPPDEVDTTPQCEPFSFSTITKPGQIKAVLGLIAFSFSALLLLASSHGLSSFIWALVDNFPLWALGGSLIGIVVAFSIVYRSRFHHAEHNKRRVLAASAALVLLAHMPGLAAHDTLHAMHVALWASVPVLTLLFLLSLWLLHKLKRQFTGVRLLTSNSMSQQAGAAPDKPLPAKHLIVPVSAPNYRPQWRNGNAGFNGPVSRIELSGTDIHADIARLNALSRPHCNWQQMLRAVQPHVDTLESVWLVGSSGPATVMTANELDARAPRGAMVAKADELGSLAFLDEAARLLRPYLHEKTVVKCCQPNHEMRFENIQHLQTGIRAITQAIRRRYKAGSHEIVIETTGGMKTTSIVGAVSTLNDESRFQYVNTSGAHEVFVFDQRIDLPPEMH